MVRSVDIAGGLPLREGLARERSEEQRLFERGEARRGHRRVPGEATAALRMTAFDVTSLRGRRADQRFNRTAVGDLLERLTWSRPDQEAIVGAPGAYFDPDFARVTYRQGDETANRVANALLAAGLEPSDRVLLYCENSVEALLAMIGIAKAGLVAVPVNPLMAPDVLTLGDRARRAALRDRRRGPARARGRAPGCQADVIDRRRSPNSDSRRTRPPSPTSRSTATTSGRCSSRAARPRCPRR